VSYPLITYEAGSMRVEKVDGDDGMTTFRVTQPVRFRLDGLVPLLTFPC
jgi:hypothetical protein